MIEIKQLTKKYHSKKTTVTALDSVDLKLPNTGMVAVCGENGCGKTTLLNILSTADTDYQGTVTYNGINYNDIVPELRRNVVSFVFQEKHFVPYLNLFDNIAIFLDSDNTEIIDTELAEFSIYDKKDEATKNLSGGQKQRGSIIRGIVKRSEILLVDEPTSSLNEEMERSVFLKLQEYSKEKLVVIVSHNVRLVRAFADLIIHIDKGKVYSVENNCKDVIEYAENEIFVPSDFCNLSALDASFVREKLNCHKSVVIRLRDATESASLRVNYDVRDTRSKWKKSKKLESNTKNRLISSSLKHVRKGVLAGVSLISLFLIMVNFLFSFAFFEKNKFVYESITNNIDGYVNFKYNSSIYENKSDKKLDVSSYMEYKNRYPATKFLLVNYEAETEFQFEWSELYSNSVFGVSYCDENDVELICGEFCEEGEILLTDYSADALISYLPNYESYDSIIEQGVVINGTLFSVSGVINTDYEKYKSLYFRDDFINSQRCIDYQYSIQNSYSRIYYSLNQYLSSDSIFYLALDYGEAFCNAKNVENCRDLILDKEVSSDCCYINEALYNVIGDVHEIKLRNDYLTVSGVIKDNDDKNNVYLPEEKIELIKRNSLQEIESIMTELSSEDEVAFLNSYNMVHSTSMSGYIDKVIEIVTLTSKIFVVLIILLVAFLVGAVSFLVGKILSSDNVTIALLKSSGYDEKSIFSFEIFKMAMVFALSAVVSSLLYIACSCLINSVLSNLFGFFISISLVSIKTIVISVLILLIVFIFVSAVMLVSKNKKKITDLINL